MYCVSQQSVDSNQIMFCYQKNLLTEQIFIKLEYDFLSYLIEGENI